VYLFIISFISDIEFGLKWRLGCSRALGVVGTHLNSSGF